MTRLAQVFFDEWPRIARMIRRMAESPEHYPNHDVLDIESRLAAIRTMCVNSLKTIAEVVLKVMGRKNFSDQVVGIARAMEAGSTDTADFLRAFSLELRDSGCSWGART